MAKIIGIQKKVSDDGRESFNYYFVSKIPSVDGLFCGSVWCPKLYTNSKTGKPICIDDEIDVSFRTSTKNGVSRSYFSFGSATIY